MDPLTAAAVAGEEGVEEVGRSSEREITVTISLEVRGGLPPVGEVQEEWSMLPLLVLRCLNTVEEEEEVVAAVVIAPGVDSKITVHGKFRGADVSAT